MPTRPRLPVVCFGSRFLNLLIGGGSAQAIWQNLNASNGFQNLHCNCANVNKLSVLMGNSHKT